MRQGLLERLTQSTRLHPMGDPKLLVELGADPPRPTPCRHRCQDEEGEMADTAGTGTQLRRSKMTVTLQAQVPR